MEELTQDACLSNLMNSVSLLACKRFQPAKKVIKN